MFSFYGSSCLCYFYLFLLSGNMIHKDHRLLVLRCPTSSAVMYRWILDLLLLLYGLVQAMVDSIREDLYEYLVSRLVARLNMVREFAEAVMGMDLEDLLKHMVPVVLPKLVLDQQHSQLALDTLHELANQLKTDLGVLLIDWGHRVLSVLLLRADGKELSAVLQFYEAQTEVPSREIFAAVLPALLDELVRSLGDIDSEEGLRR